MIEVKNLTKQYGPVTAVSDLSFTIEPGHIYGFLGPNGAGKSTTMNIMTGCLAATSGDVKINGFDIFEQPKEAKRLIGYLPEFPPLYTSQTPLEYLDFVAQAKGIKKGNRLDEIEKVILETHIEDVADRLIKHLSKGYRQRVGIAQALLGDPEVIILDEPTVGLDPRQIIEIRDLIKELGENHTVILSSHILSEVQAICDEIMIIHKGVLVAFDTPENLGNILGAGSLIEIAYDTDFEKVRGILSDIEGITEISAKGEHGAVIEFEGIAMEDLCRKIFEAFVLANETLTKLNPVTATLEDIYIELTGRDVAEPAAKAADLEPEEENTAEDEDIESEEDNTADLKDIEPEEDNTADLKDIEPEEENTADLKDTQPEEDVETEDLNIDNGGKEEEA